MNKHTFKMTIDQWKRIFGKFLYEKDKNLENSYEKKKKNHFKKTI